MTHITREELERQMQAVDLYRSGLTIHETAHVIDATPQRVELWLTKFRIVKRCACCGIILEDYDPSDADQRSCQNGTLDGIHCEYCRKHGVVPEPWQTMEVSYALNWRG